MKNMRAKDVQRFFERMATDWDTMRLAYYDERVIEKMAEISGVGEDSEAADVGTETGFVAADARCLPNYVPEPVGFSSFANTFHVVPNKTDLAREVLAPRGRVAVVNWHPTPRDETRILGQPRGPATEMRLSLEQTAAKVVPAGFELEKVADLPPYHYGAVFVWHG